MARPVNLNVPSKSGEERSLIPAIEVSPKLADVAETLREVLSNAGLPVTSVAVRTDAIPLGELKSRLTAAVRSVLPAPIWTPPGVCVK